MNTAENERNVQHYEIGGHGYMNWMNSKNIHILSWTCEVKICQKQAIKSQQNSETERQGKTIILRTTSLKSHSFNEFQASTINERTSIACIKKYQLFMTPSWTNAQKSLKFLWLPAARNIGIKRCNKSNKQQSLSNSFYINYTKHIRNIRKPYIVTVVSPNQHQSW